MEQAQITDTYVQKTRDISVSVTPQFIESESDPLENVYVFAYHVVLENTGDQTVQLLNRHWIVMSGGIQIADVKGEGVIGEQPVLEPGDTHQYTSWTVIRDPFGSMYGTYTFRSARGEFFDVKIPRFNLIHIDSSTVH
ncbi:MAG: Co2+/Mg2+ efflux protein ApaG [Candidatus Dadabacteria bacterium]|nr:MAG: Co2+/Mg2+ efflux protein ApaG [Candidatus Dadabacteria bacterium]